MIRPHGPVSVRSILIVLFLTLAVSAFAQPAFQQASFGDYQLEWRVVGQELELRYSAQTTGWVAIGFKPSRMMRDANIIIGYVSGGQVTVEDHFGNRNTSHTQDAQLGGSRDLRVIGGSESGGRTTLHVAVPLDSGDPNDQAMSAGEELRIIYAWGRNGADNTSAYHAGRGGANIRL